MFDTIMRKAPDLLNSLCSASPVVECHETGLQEMGGKMPWGLNVIVTGREESMAAGSLWFLGGYLSYWEGRRKKRPLVVLGKVLSRPIFNTPAGIFVQ